ncbi:hypothetical protein EJ08DRAFT_203430 [Tothia fuscella]|uniref:Uncharacterized protein n=1 Tax=Tothia fuscella TaxID=1048955 RepID=A0A9P4NSM1_9PEZI|nr:hypothetical protein EJ08DRAFT_203430 [Tothia fuscella]
MLDCTAQTNSANMAPARRHVVSRHHTGEQNKWPVADGHSLHIALSASDCENEDAVEHADVDFGDSDNDHSDEEDSPYNNIDTREMFKQAIYASKASNESKEEDTADGGSGETAKDVDDVKESRKGTQNEGITDGARLAAQDNTDKASIQKVSIAISTYGEQK